MNRQLKITITWGLIALGLAIHLTLESRESLFYDELPKAPYNDGFPMEEHIIYLLAMVMPMLMAFLTLFYDSKGFKLFSLVFAILLGLMNTVHALEPFMGGGSNTIQMALLPMVAAFYIVQLVQIVHWRKGHKTKKTGYGQSG
ncbi:MAG: hypothetical protein AAGF96_15190 [Bacteroidota bacterium]